MLNLKERGLSNHDVAALLGVPMVKRPLAKLMAALKETDTCAFHFTGTVTC
jgi:hypothetical protein